MWMVAELFERPLKFFSVCVVPVSLIVILALRFQKHSSSPQLLRLSILTSVNRDPGAGETRICSSRRVRLFLP